jgi:methionine synthase I (cobalamin-dependent)
LGSRCRRSRGERKFVELQQVGHLLAYADEADGQVEFLGDGHGDAALGRAVELGEHDAGDAGGLGELARLLEAVLAGGGVHHQQHLVGRAGNQLGGGAAHLVQLVHQAGFGVQAAGGVHNQLVDLARLGGGDGVVKHGRRVAAVAGLDHLHAGARGPDFKLLDGRGAEGVGGAEENGAVLRARIAIIDGAMGTTIRTYGMTEADIRGERFKDSKKDLLNNGDLFSLTQPKMICDIHRRFSRPARTSSRPTLFGATSIGQSEFFVDDPREHGGRKDPGVLPEDHRRPFLNDLAWEINEQSARQCREWADRVANATGGSASWPAHRAADGFALELARRRRRGLPRGHVRPGEAAYAAGPRAHRGRLGLLLVETIFDSLNAKAALVAIQEVFEQDGKELPIMISAAVGRGGETMISAQTIEAFWNAVKHVKPISVGLNCSLGPDLMRPFLAELARRSRHAISCYPNAGLPNPLSPTGFDLEPADMAASSASSRTAG